MQVTGQVECKRVVKWSAISQENGVELTRWLRFNGQPRKIERATMAELAGKQLRLNRPHLIARRLLPPISVGGRECHPLSTQGDEQCLHLCTRQHRDAPSESQDQGLNSSH